MKTAGEMRGALGLTLEAGDGGLGNAVSGGYAGDLLSWVMGNAEPGQVLVTVMNNINVAAVAQLADLSAVILSEGSAPDAQLKGKADALNIPLFTTARTTFDTACALGKFLSDA